MLEFDPTSSAAAVLKSLTWPIAPATAQLIETLCETDGRNPPSRSVRGIYHDFREVFVYDPRFPRDAIAVVRIVFRVDFGRLKVAIVELSTTRPI
ncbi:MAG: hypothetical protein HQL39_00440 [Alphaproteobacteria bacterium]|nr:hypothetical protein [Alphaproteobacteria bacterium]